MVFQFGMLGDDVGGGDFLGYTLGIGVLETVRVWTGTAWRQRSVRNKLISHGKNGFLGPQIACLDFYAP